jgi:hypothetical protein
MSMPGISQSLFGKSHFSIYVHVYVLSASIVGSKSVCKLSCTFSRAKLMDVLTVLAYSKSKRMKASIAGASRRHRCYSVLRGNCKLCSERPLECVPDYPVHKRQS